MAGRADATEAGTTSKASSESDLLGIYLNDHLAGLTVEVELGRLKPNGYLRGRSPLSIVVELEGLRLAAEHKALGWCTLRELAQHDSRLDLGRLDRLLDRGRRQADTLEELRARKVTEVFGAAGVNS